MGEAKLAINNLYSRISGKDKGREESDIKPNPSNPIGIKLTPSDLSAPADQPGSKNDASNSERTISDKLNAIQNRIMDMSAVVQKVEQFLARERDQRKA
jgi:hypothetical protein